MKASIIPIVLILSLYITSAYAQSNLTYGDGFKTGFARQQSTCPGIIDGIKDLTPCQWGYFAGQHKASELTSAFKFGFAHGLVDKSQGILRTEIICKDFSTIGIQYFTPKDDCENGYGDGFESPSL
jgi:hypothetical protein